MDLHNIVAGLATGKDARVIVGLAPPDDAAVVMSPDGADGLALVQTLDFITPVCDDPRLFGQIAAANSLSDIYAMGGRVYTALNICCFPTEGIDVSVLREILLGGADKVAEAGGVVVGGHTVKDPELKYGLSVTGVIRSDRIWRKGGAVPGDVLVLTKPIGTGVMITARKKGIIDDTRFMPAALNMARLNLVAAETAARFRVHAATDITGFGLAGHALEMSAAGGDAVAIKGSSSASTAGGVGFRIDLQKVPRYPEALDLMSSGVATGVTGGNRDNVKDRVRVEQGARAFEGLLYDPQTSGGLLLAVHPDDAQPLLGALGEVGETDARAIGEVVSGESGVWAR